MDDDRGVRVTHAFLLATDYRILTTALYASYTDTEDQHLRRAGRGGRIVDADAAGAFRAGVRDVHGAGRHLRRARHAHVGRDGEAGGRGGAAVERVPRRARHAHVG